jgi:hypothetical protein
MKSSLHILFSFLPFLLNYSANFQLRKLSQFSQSQSQCYFTTDVLPPIISSWRQTPGDSRPVFFQLSTCGYSPSSCLVMDISSGSTIPAFRFYVKICLYIYLYTYTHTLSRLELPNFTLLRSCIVL